MLTVCFVHYTVHSPSTERQILPFTKTNLYLYTNLKSIDRAGKRKSPVDHVQCVCVCVSHTLVKQIFEEIEKKPSFFDML